MDLHEYPYLQPGQEPVVVSVGPTDTTSLGSPTHPWAITNRSSIVRLCSWTARGARVVVSGQFECVAAGEVSAKWGITPLAKSSMAWIVLSWDSPPQSKYSIRCSTPADA
jgi:hypothetical protein